MAEAENEISLPKATIQKLVKEFVSPDYRVAGDLLDLLMACCTEFIQLVSSEANEIATKEHKNTIHPEHVIRALTELGFHDFVKEVTSTWDQYKADTKTTNTQKANLRKTGAEQAGLSEEEQIALQQQMFAAARAHSMTSVDAAAVMQAAYTQQLAAVGGGAGGAPGQAYGEGQMQPGGSISDGQGQDAGS